MPAASDTVFAATSERERQSWHAAIREAANEVQQNPAAELRSPDSYRSAEAAVPGSVGDTPLHVATSGIGDRVMSGEGMDSWVQVSSRGSPQRWDGSRASDALAAAGGEGGSESTSAAVAALSNPTDAAATSANAIDALDPSAPVSPDALDSSAPVSPGVVAANSVSATVPDTLAPCETTTFPVAAANPGFATEPTSITEPVPPQLEYADDAVRPVECQHAALLGGMVSHDDSGAVASLGLCSLPDARAGAAADSAASEQSDVDAPHDLENAALALGPENRATAEVLPVAASPITAATQTLSELPSSEDGQRSSLPVTGASGGDAGVDADDTQAPTPTSAAKTDVESAVAPRAQDSETPKSVLEAPERSASSPPLTASSRRVSNEERGVAFSVEPAVATANGRVIGASDASDGGDAIVQLAAAQPPVQGFVAASEPLDLQTSARPSPSQPADVAGPRSPSTLQPADFAGPRSPSPLQPADVADPRSPDLSQLSTHPGAADLSQPSTLPGAAAHDKPAAPLFASKPEPEVHHHDTRGFTTVDAGYQLWDTALLAALVAIGLATLYSSFR